MSSGGQWPPTFESGGAAAPPAPQVLHHCGHGAFGEVYKGVWCHAVIGCEEPVEEEVAVKTMKSDYNKEDRIKFLQEAAIMGQFDHPNIVKVMGIMATDTIVRST